MDFWPYTMVTWSLLTMDLTDAVMLLLSWIVVVFELIREYEYGLIDHLKYKIYLLNHVLTYVVSYHAIHALSILLSFAEH